MEIGTQVKVIHSSFSQVKKGAIGEVVSVKRSGQRSEADEVLFKDGLTWHFLPWELEIL